jgi:lipopolysaccharide transport system permease protein
MTALPTEVPAGTAGPVGGRAHAAPGPPPTPYLRIRPSSGWAALNLRETWQFRDLLFTLAGRDLKLRYKQTALGVVWVVLQPLLAAGIFAFVFGKVAKLPSDGVPYFVFAFAGLLGWNLFSNILTKASGCLVGNAPLISKVFFPRLVLPLSTVPSVLVDFGIAAVLMAGLLVSHRIAPGWGLLLLPIWVALIAALALGVGLVTAALTVSYRDVQYILPVFTQMLLYASPVAYPASEVPAEWRSAYFLNPLAPLLEGFRWSLFGTTTPPPWGSVGYAAAVAAGVLLWGAFAFKRMERRFADVI